MGPRNRQFRHHIWAILYMYNIVAHGTVFLNTQPISSLVFTDGVLYPDKLPDRRDRQTMKNVGSSFWIPGVPSYAVFPGGSSESEDLSDPTYLGTTGYNSGRSRRSCRPNKISAGEFPPCALGKKSPLDEVSTELPGICRN